MSRAFDCAGCGTHVPEERAPWMNFYDLCDACFPAYDRWKMGLRFSQPTTMESESVENWRRATGKTPE